MLWYPLSCVELVIHHVWKIRRYFTKPYTYFFLWSPIDSTDRYFVEL
ncbi:unnamed protein product [Brassica rapa]|uniref:Uncharacterized protein n=1 Tax=Brassica campestris TaxID=3711 RepID=A0A8D9DBD8_BRACM|nr:unnamed protein product [Brassica rapa]